MKKIFPVAALTLCTAIFTTTACAQELTIVDESITYNKLSQKENDRKRVKREERSRYKNDHVSGGTATKNFDVPKNFGNVKVWFENKGTADVEISVQKGHEVKFSQTVKPGEKYTGYSDKAFSTGEHSVHVSSAEADINGDISVKVADQNYKRN